MQKLLLFLLITCSLIQCQITTNLSFSSIKVSRDSFVELTLIT